MAIYSVWMLEKQNITVSGGVTLDGVTQGNGSHLLTQTITLNSKAWKQTFIDDEDTNFDDNDGNQTLSGTQDIDGSSYASGTGVEAEYQVTLTDPATGKTWTAYAYNVNNSSPAFATIEGLMLRPDVDGDFPPVGVPLTVTATAEGPGGAGTNPYDFYAEPPCFTVGTLIMTPAGPRSVETLIAGDLVLTRDHGAQPLRWIGRVQLSADHLARHPEHSPVSLAPDAISPGKPKRMLQLSPQHRLLIGGWKAELLFGQPEVLVPVIALVNDANIRLEPTKNDVTYLHLLFDRHEILDAEGVEVESLHAPWLRRAALPQSVRSELEALFPDLFSDAEPLPPARACLTAQEGRALYA